MDTDVTEPVPIATDIATDEAPRRWTGGRPATMVASAGLGAVLAAIVVLVWAFSSGPQSANQHPNPDSAASPATAEPAALKPSEPLPPVAGPDAATLPGGLPGGLPAGLTQPGASSGSGNPLDAFTPRPSVISGGAGPAAAWPAPPPMPPLPDLQTVLDTAAPYLLPALAPSVVSGDAIASILGSAGGWATAAAVATANNTTDILVALILGNAELGINPLDFLVQASQGATSMMNLPTPQQLMGLPGALNVNLPALDALSKFGMPQLPAPPPIGMPQFPIGMPQLPPPPPIGFPKLPPPPRIGLPPPPPAFLIPFL